MADQAPTKAQMLAEAYRRGLMPPGQAAAYEEAARRGLVSDPYAVQHGTASNPVVGYLNRAIGQIPFLPEANAALRAGVETGAQALSGQKADFGANYNYMRASDQGAQDRFDQDHPFASADARAVGTLAPIAATMGMAAPEMVAATAEKGAAGGFRAAAGRLAASGARNAMTGAGIGAVYGAAQPGTLQQREASAARGLLPGAAVGAIAPVALSVAGNALRAMAPAPDATSAAAEPPVSVIDAARGAPSPSSAAPATPSPGGPGATPPQSVTTLTPVEASALGKFIRVAKPDVNAMTGKAAAFADAGIDPTLVDTTGRRGQGIVRALATRATPAQDAVEAFAEQRRVGLASRMSDQARNIISTDPRTPDDIAQTVIDARNAQADKDFGPVRDQMVQVTPSMEDALTSPFGIRAIRTAWQRAVDPVARESLRLLYDHVNPGQGGQDAGSLKGAQISVGQAQDISKALFDDAASAKDPGDAGPMKYFGQAIRTGASMQAPDYELALSRFANASGLAEAPAIGKQALGSSTDTFIADVGRLAAIPSEPNADGGAVGPIGISLARPGFRRAIESASGGGRPGTALGVAQTLADAPEQQAKNAALLGDDDAGRLQNAMRLERQAVLNASAASPGAGSNTFLNQIAGGATNGEVSAGEVAKTAASAAAASHGNLAPAAMQAISAYLKNTRAFSDDEAEALANLAIDPTRHADALNFIAGRAGPQAAEDLAPVMQQAAGVAPATAAAAAAAATSNAMQPQGQAPDPTQ